MSIRRHLLALGGGALALFMLTAPPALAVEFGDDTSQWANDGECDDPRFEGPGMAIAGSLTDANIMRDATDCQALYEAGEVTLIGGTDGAPGATTAKDGVDLSHIDFGDDSGLYPDDGECDDPRFEGSGVWSQAGPEGVRADATDCREAVEAGTATYVGEIEATNGGDDVSDIDFGDDSGPYPFDGECDDPRFEGPGVWIDAGPEGVRADATDCREAVEAGTAFYMGEYVGRPSDTSGFGTDAIDYGDDSGAYPLDGECDDPRFEGPGVWADAGPEGIRADATDCREAVEAGTATYIGEVGAADPPGIDWGDDSSDWANDGECDDPRFDGPGMAIAESLTDSNIMRDATDCRALYEAGEIHLLGQSGAIDFGDDSGMYPNDGECDDPRFAGPGMAIASSLTDANAYGDATDCEMLYEAGEVWLAADTGDADVSGIDFGDDSGPWPNDGECDDPRFEGPGMAAPEYLRDENRFADATDCRELFLEGQVTLLPGADSSTIDFGDDSGDWPNDQECDDPRFEGPGMAISLSDDNTLRDATDCLALFDAGMITLRDAGGPDGATGDDGALVVGDIDFGDNSSDYAFNGECDDPRFEGEGMASILLFADRMADAADCAALYEAGSISFSGVDGSPGEAGVDGIDFGDDGSDWADNGVCDDPRFEGPGVDSVLLSADRGRDATDCRALFEAGQVRLAGVIGAAPLVDEIDFGDDSGPWPNDGECDDPRFEGPGVYAEAGPDGLMADATDCRALFEAGEIWLRNDAG